MVSDLAIIGGSFAGLSAAIHFGRAGRTATVFDAGEPRNRYAAHAHGILGYDGAEPSVVLSKAREQTGAYPSVTLKNTLVVGVEQREEGFAVIAEGGEVFQARRLLIATGVSDTFPEIEGLQSRWGSSVLHCPYCHGYEFMGERTGIYAQGPIAFHQALLIADWGPVTLFTNGMIELDEVQKAQLAIRGVAVEETPIAKLDGTGQQLSKVELADGRSVPLDVLYIATKVTLRHDWISGLGCAIDQGPLGPMIATDERQATNIPGIFAAGDCARQPHNVTFASADGVTAATAIHMSLIAEEIEKAQGGTET